MFSKKKILLIIATLILVLIILLTCITNINNKDIKEENEIQDTTSPIIVLNDSYAVKTGYDKNLVDVIMSADDIDPNPKREIIGEYDLNQEGNYNLTYKIEDSNGNSMSKDLTLKVRDNYSYKEEDIDLKDAINNYKTEDTEIGIDVSKWQGKINWEKVANAGVEFVIIRMGYQNGFNGEVLEDPYFEQNVSGCLKNHLPVAVYFSSYAQNPDEAKSQANWIKDILSSNKYSHIKRVAFDWENWNSFNKLGLSLRDINNIADSFMEEIETSNFKSILYGSKTYLEAVWKNKNNYPVWLANYVSETTYEGDYKMWQFCQTGIIDGITGPVDINVMYN